MERAIRRDDRRVQRGRGGAWRRGRGGQRGSRVGTGARVRGRERPGRVVRGTERVVRGAGPVRGRSERAARSGRRRWRAGRTGSTVPRRGRTEGDDGTRRVRVAGRKGRVGQGERWRRTVPEGYREGRDALGRGGFRRGGVGRRWHGERRRPRVWRWGRGRRKPGWKGVWYRPKWAKKGWWRWQRSGVGAARYGERRRGSVLFARRRARWIPHVALRLPAWGRKAPLVSQARWGAAGLSAEDRVAYRGVAAEKRGQGVAYGRGAEPVGATGATAQVGGDEGGATGVIGSRNTASTGTGWARGAGGWARPAGRGARQA